MAFPDKPKVAPAETVSDLRGHDRLGETIGSENSNLHVRRQHLAAHLHDCGPRPVLEALIAIDAGTLIDEVLEDFGRLPPSVYRSVGADVLPIHRLVVVRGRHA
jgi:hypothetical protein